MIVARAPARISFGGGGTDLAAYYEHFGGFVVSTAINRYCTVTLREADDRSIRMRSEGFPLSPRTPPGVCPPVEGDLQLPAAVVERYFDRGLRDTGLDLTISSDIPHGCGLGSSSAVTVALVAAVAAFTGETLHPAEVAGIACEIEIDRLGMPIGRQDQYASAFGGLNVIEFGRRATCVKPLHLPSPTLQELNGRLLLFSTGKSRKAATILHRQRRDTRSKPVVVESLHRIKELAGGMVDTLRAGDLDAFGRLLHASWQEKKRLSHGISSGDIDRWYTAAREAGALGGKITGAGGGGFLMLYCPPDSRQRVRQTMNAFGLSELAYSFDGSGVTLLHPYGHGHPLVADPAAVHGVLD